MAHGETWLLSPFNDSTWLWVGAVGVVTGYCRHLVLSNGSHIRIQRTEDRIHWGWIADIFFSVIAAYVNVVAFFLAGPLTIIQGLWAAALGGLAGPAFLVQLMKERWLHEVEPPSGGVDLK